MALTPAQFAKRVLAWFDVHGRTDLPWQKKRNAYRVWVSEIMLQQTQVKTVIPYFNAFMQRFPDVHTLAAADDDEVMAYWSGLGYYSRARNLHKAARIVAHEHKGRFPKSVDALMQLPGIGRSTAGAIIAQAYAERAAILDGNVKRVLARFYAVSGWPGDKAVHDALWLHAEKNTPYERVAEYTQAMMDIGATVCTRSKPQCANCPLQSHCAAHAQNAIAQFPGRKPKKTMPVKTGFLYHVENAAGEVYLTKRPAKGIWGGLWSLPQSDAAPDVTLADVRGEWQVGEQRRHTFSHYHFDFRPVHVQLDDGGPTAKAKKRNTSVANQTSPQKRAAKGANGEVAIIRALAGEAGDAAVGEGRWMVLEEALALGLPAPVRRLLEERAAR